MGGGGCSPLPLSAFFMESVLSFSSGRPWVKARPRQPPACGGLDPGRAPLYGPRAAGVWGSAPPGEQGVPSPGSPTLVGADGARGAIATKPPAAPVGTWLRSGEHCQKPEASPPSPAPLCVSLLYSHLISGFEIQPLALRPKIDVRLSLLRWRLLSM